MNLRSQSAFDQFFALTLVVLGVLFRLAPHPDNVTPTMAIALFAGATLPPALAFSVPLAVMMVSDFFIGLHSLYLLVWVCFMGVVFLGVWASKYPGLVRTLIAAVSGSVLFFVLTNLGVFFFDALYPRTWAGLVECFVMAIPFFKNSFIGDLVYTTVFFSLYLAAQWSHHLFQKSKIS